jgi:hypothetical protein
MYIFLSLWGYKSWFWYATLPYFFDMLHRFCSAAFLLCATLPHWFVALLWYATLLLICCIALICYIATLLWYATLLLFCCIALMCYITTLLWYATLPLTCRIALICYIAFNMSHCFDMLQCFLICCIALICYIAQWRNWAKWDECGNMDQHYCTIKISASNNMLQIGHSIKFISESI